MANNTSNQEKLIATMGSGHIAKTTSANCTYRLPKSKKTAKFENWIETRHCAWQQASIRTLIQGARLIHHESKIGLDASTSNPSTCDAEHDENDTTGKKHHCAEIMEHSPNVKVEEKFIVRTNDPTWQDIRIGRGRMIEGGQKDPLEDADKLLDKQCSVVKIEIACSHREAYRDLGQAPVFEVVHEDSVKIRVTRINALGMGDPICREPKKPRGRGKAKGKPHAHLYASRDAMNVVRSAYEGDTELSKARVEELLGKKISARVDEFELKDWFGQKRDRMGIDAARDKEVKAQNATLASNDRVARDQSQALGDAARADQIARGNAAAQAVGTNAPAGTLARSVRAATGGAPVANPTVASGYTRPDRGLSGNISGAATDVAKATDLLQNLARAVLLLSAPPIVVNLEAMGCAGARPIAIKGYSNEKVVLKIHDYFETKGATWLGKLGRVAEIVKTMKTYVDTITAPLPRAFRSDLVFDFSVFGLATRERLAQPSSDPAKRGGLTGVAADRAPKLEITIQRKELTKDSTVCSRKWYEVYPAWKIDAGIDKLLYLYFKASFDISFVGGPFVKFATVLLKALGIESGIKISFEFLFQVDFTGFGTLDEYGEWGGDAGVAAPVKAIAVISLTFKAGPLFITFAGQARWEPTLALSRKDFVERNQLALLARDADLIFSLYVEAGFDIFGWKVSEKFPLGDHTTKVGSPVLALFQFGSKGEPPPEIK